MHMVDIGTTVLVAAGYCGINAAVVGSLWYFLVKTPFERSYMPVLLRSGMSLFVVWVLTLLISGMFCWTASIGQCLSCICPVIRADFIRNVSPVGLFFFLATAVFVQLVLIAVPQRLSRLLFVVTLIASNVIASLLMAGLTAVLI